MVIRKWLACHQNTGHSIALNNKLFCSLKYTGNLLFLLFSNHMRLILKSDKKSLAYSQIFCSRIEHRVSAR